jgi:hypothetical protein
VTLVRQLTWLNASDLNALAVHWQSNDTVWSAGDFTGDGRVDADDLNWLGLSCKRSIPLAAAYNVPEPSCHVLLVAIGLFGILRNWRH